MFNKKRAMNKKGQAAMEFLMTYGWAILAAVIVVGVLWYMIGDPSSLVGDKFDMAAPVVGNAMIISTTSIQLEMRNGGVSSMNVTSVLIEGCSDNTDNWMFLAGDLNTSTVTCDSNLISGDRFNGDVTITYRTSGSSLDQKATGTISGKVL